MKFGKKRNQYLLANEISRRIIQKRFQNRHQRVFVLPQQTECDLARPPERPVVSVGSEGVDHVVRQTEGDKFRFVEREALLSFSMFFPRCNPSRSHREPCRKDS